MSLEDAEVPQSRVGAESLGPVTSTNRRLYFAVIVLLGVVLVIGVVGWLLLAANSRAMPSGLSALLGTVTGALVALISSDAKN
jgi:hypothetical protein